MLQTDNPLEADSRFHFLDCTSHACTPAVQQQQPPQTDHRTLSPQARRLLTLRNCAVVFAAVLFYLSLLFMTTGQNLSFRLKAIAYFIGASAYGCEYLMLTDCCRHKPANREMLMSNVFGVMYIIMGISYFNH
jgi:hypothetical protein